MASTSTSRRRPASAAALDEPGDEELDEVVPARAPATERRRAADALVTVWTGVTRDLALSQRGLDRAVHDLDLLDDIGVLAERLDPTDIASFLDRLGSAAVLIAGNVSPELVLDDLALAWPAAARRVA
jgi:hypothetical protein